MKRSKFLFSSLRRDRKKKEEVRPYELGATSSKRAVFEHVLRTVVLSLGVVQKNNLKFEQTHSKTAFH
jgi:hypothetical protein